MHTGKGKETAVTGGKRAFMGIVLAATLMAGTRGICFARSLVLQWGTTPGAMGYRVHYQADSSAKPFTGTGAIQGASPLDMAQETGVTIDGLDPGRDYYFAVTAYSAGGESAYSNVIHVFPQTSSLTVNLAGNGEGSVNSSPSGIACSSGSCSAQFTSGASVTLLPSPASGATSLSYLSSWSGCASVLGGSCTVVAGDAAVVTATFSALQPVRVRGGSYYSLVQNAYGGAGEGDEIQAQAVTLTGDVTTGIDRSVTLAGGFNANYSGVSGVSLLKGKLSVTRGTLIVANIAIL